MSVALPLRRFLRGTELQLAVTREGSSVRGYVLNADGKKKLATTYVTLPNKGSPVLFIRGFYVHVRMTPAGFTDEEKTAGKGLGKLMLCALMSHLNLDSTTPVELEASGGTVPPGHVHTESEQEVDAFLAKYYPGVLDDLAYDARLIGLTAPSLEEKQVAYRKILENRNLIKYYEGYGFAVVKDTGMAARMRSTVGQIMAACGSKGGRRRKTHRRGRGPRKTQRRKAYKPSRG